MRGLDDWIERQPEPKFKWTCPECEEELYFWTLRETEDPECPVCAEAEEADEETDNGE